MESKYTPENNEFTAPRDDAERAERLLAGRCAECGFLWEYHKMSCPHDPRHDSLKQLVKMAKEIEAEKATHKMAQDKRLQQVLNTIRNNTHK